MRIIVCVKAVPDNDNIQKGLNNALVISGELAVGQYDYNAVEAAVRLKEAIPGSTVTALTLCPAESGCTSKIKKAVLSRGVDEMYVLMDEAFKGADSLMTAKCLAAAIEKLGSADLVLCGEGSGDMYNQQVGIVVGALLKRPTLNGICRLEYRDDALYAGRLVENETEEYTVSMPAVLSVTSDINTPRIASLKEILAAGKKPSTVWNAGEFECEAVKGSSRKSVLAPEHTRRKCEIVTGDDEAAVAQFYDILRKSL